MFRRITAAAALVVALAACKDNNVITANQVVMTDTLVAYALTGTPASLPSGLASTLGTTVRVDGSGSFDIAFDIASADSVRVYPVRTIVTPVPGIVPPSVGLQLATQPFDSIKSAPGGYYRPDTAVTIRTGQPFLLLTSRSTGALTCIYNPSPHVYAKVVVDSVQLANRAIYLRQVVNPNCGYRSLLPGLPTS